jgi:hypothetical protein
MVDVIQGIKQSLAGSYIVKVTEIIYNTDKHKEICVIFAFA